VPSFAPGWVLVGSYGGAVHEVDLVPYFSGAVLLRLQLSEYLLPNGLLLPAVQATVGRLPRTVALGQVSPGRAGLRNSNKDGVQNTGVILRQTTSGGFLRRQESSDLLPLLTGELLSATHPT
jgi:hypothetical protein